MIKKILMTVTVVLLFMTGITRGNEGENETKKIYYADAQLFRLIGVHTQIRKASPTQQAQEMLDIIIEGHDDNDRIIRVIPAVKGGLRVKVNDRIAVVNIDKRIVSKINKNKDAEKLAVYSIVNSLSEIDGIDIVRFTVDGKVKKDFAGFLDMREPFVPDYMY